MLNPVSPFVSRRTGQDCWALSSSALDAWRRGSQTEVPPWTMEWFPTLECNANCPGCSFFQARHIDWKGLRAAAKPDDVRTISYSSARMVLDRAREAGVRAVLNTGGGEFGVHPDRVRIMEYIASLGMVQAVYTNGLHLAADSVESDFMFDPGLQLVFIRVSINAGTPESARRHWGIREDALQIQLESLKNLYQARARAMSRFQGCWIPSIQISTIVDNDTAGDLEVLSQFIADTAKQFQESAQPDDRIIVRPSTAHGEPAYGCHDHSEAVPERILSVFGRSGSARPTLTAAGIGVDTGFGLADLDSGHYASYSQVIAAQYARRAPAWATGLFLTVGPDGSVYPCTEMGCRPEWVMGNLLQQTVEEVYRSERRVRALRLFEAAGWGPALFQPFGRSQRLDRIVVAFRRGAFGEETLEEARRAAKSSPPLLLN